MKRLLLICLLAAEPAMAQSVIGIGDGVRGGGPIAVSVANAQPLSGLQFTVTDSPSALSATVVQAAGRADGVFDVVELHEADGRLVVLAMSSDPTVTLSSGSGPVLELEFELASGAGVGPVGLGISDVFAVSSTGHLTDVTANDGTYFDPEITVFSEVGKAAGFDRLFEITCCHDTFGAAWGDYDTDGDEDLLQVGFLSALHRNDGDGTFAETGQVNGLAGAVNTGTSPVWGDYDNDGDLDLFVVSQSGDRFLLRNDAGSFSDVTSGSGLQVSSDAALSANWVDFNGDGRLDLYTNDGFLYRNDENGVFTDVGDASGIGSNPFGGTSWADYDYDGDPDLMTTEGLFRNDGGSFSNVAPDAGIVGGAGFGGGVAWADMNNDGHLDVYLARSDFQASTLYRNDGDGTFTDISGPSGVGLDLVRTASWSDIDLDGDLDLFLARPSASSGRYRLFRNDGDEVFTDVTQAASLTEAPWLLANSSGEPGAAAAWADYNGDGRPDLFVANGRPPNLLYENLGNGVANGYLVVRLVGTDSNRSAMGARVTIWTGDSFQVREVEGGANTGQSSLPVEFGLGAASQVDRIVVEWPSGLAETKTDPTSPDQYITITEGTLTASGVRSGQAPSLPDELALHPAWPNPFSVSTRLRFALPRDLHVTLDVFDLLGRKVAGLVDGLIPAGIHGIAWQAPVASGVYLVRIQAGGETRTQTLVRTR